MRERWGITALLRDLPEKPRWMINATCYETGKNWRFERFRMGDYLFGYSRDPDLLLGDALAASAGFPCLIGAYPLDASRFQWYRYLDEETGNGLEAVGVPDELITQTDPAFQEAHLWDGGVYDNLGLEGVHDFNRGWSGWIDFLIVSDASGRASMERYQPGAKALLRIITGIMMDQIRSLRSRAVLERLGTHRDPGAFLQIGNGCKEILTQAGRASDADRLLPQCLGPDETERAARMETVIRRLTNAEYERLFRHGFEVADLTLYAYHEAGFGHIAYSDSRWGKE